MLRPVRARPLAAALILFAVVLLEGAHRNTREDLIWQHRNLGKAFYENPTTQKQAVDEFRKALELNPGSACERLNYGLALLKAGESERGAAELVAVQRQDARLPIPGSISAFTTKSGSSTAKPSNNSRASSASSLMSPFPTTISASSTSRMAALSPLLND